MKERLMEAKYEFENDIDLRRDAKKRKQKEEKTKNE